MKFGITLFGTHPLTKPSPENFRDIIELATAAQRLGFDMVYAGQHYMVKHFQKFQPIPALSRVSACTSSMYINITDLVPLNHPVRLAEELASMDAMTNGHVVLTAALGYAEHEFRAFGVPKRERVARLVEAVEVITRLWTEDEVDFNGRFYKLRGVSVNPKPVQKPRPPIWMTADNTKGVIRSAQRGDVWFMSDHNRLAELKELVGEYDRHRRDSCRDFHHIGFERPLLRTALVASTRKEAYEIARPFMEEYWQNYYGQMDQAAEMNVPDDLNQPFEELWKDRFIFADPAGCVEEIRRYQEQLGVDSIVFYFPAPLEHQLRSMELLSARVLPYFR